MSPWGASRALEATHFFMNAARNNRRDTADLLVPKALDNKNHRAPPEIHSSRMHAERVTSVMKRAKRKKSHDSRCSVLYINLFALRKALP